MIEPIHTLERMKREIDLALVKARLEYDENNIIAQWDRGFIAALENCSDTINRYIKENQ